MVLLFIVIADKSKTIDNSMHDHQIICFALLRCFEESVSTTSVVHQLLSN